MSVASAIARPYRQPCYGGCGATWRGDKQWVTDWQHGEPRAYCRHCGLDHVQTAEHREAARAKASVLGGS
jgi:hypothetical protein